MDYKVVYTKASQKDLNSLDSSIAQRILEKTNEYSKPNRPLLKAKKLKAFELNTYRFRVGDYRVIFRLDPQNQKLVVLVVLKVAHRKNVYDKSA